MTTSEITESFPALPPCPDRLCPTASSLHVCLCTARQLEDVSEPSDRRSTERSTSTPVGFRTRHPGTQVSPSVYISVCKGQMMSASERRREREWERGSVLTTKPRCSQTDAAAFRCARMTSLGCLTGTRVWQAVCHPDDEKHSPPNPPSSCWMSPNPKFLICSSA